MTSILASLTLLSQTLAFQPSMTTVTIESLDLHRVNAGRLGERVSGSMVVRTSKGDVTIDVHPFHTLPNHGLRLMVGGQIHLPANAIERGSVTMSDVRR